MKQIVRVLSVVVLAVVMTASGASAYSFDFAGAYQFSDSDGDGFSETLTLDGFGGKAPVFVFHPGPDAVFGIGSYVTLAPLVFDPDNFVSGVSYGFTGNPYVQGFNVYDGANTLLMTADYTLDKLIVDTATATINADLDVNLTNTVHLVSGSPILDAFHSNGALNLTLNFSRDIADIVERGDDDIGTFSGSAIAIVPEPATLFLLGAGLIGLLGIGRKFKQ